MPTVGEAVPSFHRPKPYQIVHTFDPIAIKFRTNLRAGGRMVGSRPPRIVRSPLLSSLVELAKGKTPALAQIAVTPLDGQPRRRRVRTSPPWGTARANRGVDGSSHRSRAGGLRPRHRASCPHTARSGRSNPVEYPVCDRRSIKSF